MDAHRAYTVTLSGQPTDNTAFYLVSEVRYIYQKLHGWQVNKGVELFVRNTCSFLNFFLSFHILRLSNDSYVWPVCC